MSLKVDKQVMAVFCYGSNSTKQLQERVHNSSLTSHAAYIVGYKRIFAGNAIKWGGGGAASLLVTNNDQDKVFGTIVYLTSEEMNSLDRFEGIPEFSDPFSDDDNINVYRRVFITAYLPNVNECGTENTFQDTKINAIAYIKNNHSYHSYPSEKYLQACYNHLSPFWPDLDGEQALHVYCSESELRGCFSGLKEVYISSTIIQTSTSITQSINSFVSYTKIDDSIHKC